MQEKLKIGETVTFIMNGKPINPVNKEVDNKPPEESKEVKETSE